MTTVTRWIESDRRTVADAYGTAPRTVVAVPPSAAELDPRFMLVSVGGSPTLRPFDNTLEQP
jgi:hypothetical protein